MMKVPITIFRPGTVSYQPPPANKKSPFGNSVPRLNSFLIVNHKQCKEGMDGMRCDIESFTIVICSILQTNSPQIAIST